MTEDTKNKDRERDREIEIEFGCPTATNRNDDGIIIFFARSLFANRP